MRDQNSAADFAATARRLDRESDMRHVAYTTDCLHKCVENLRAAARSLSETNSNVAVNCQDVAARLWEMSQELNGIEFDLVEEYRALSSNNGNPRKLGDL